MRADARSAAAQIGRSRRRQRPTVRVGLARRARGVRHREVEPGRRDPCERRHRRGGEPLSRLGAHVHDGEAVANHQLFPLVQVRRRRAARLERPLPLPGRSLVTLEIVEGPRAHVEREPIEEPTTLRPSAHRERDFARMKHDDRRTHRICCERRRTLPVDPRRPRPRLQPDALFARLVVLPNPRAHARDLFPVPNDIAGLRRAKASRGRENVDRLEQVRLSLPVVAREDVEARTRREVDRFQVAKRAKRQRLDREGPHARCAWA